MDPSGAAVGKCICEDGYYDDETNSLCDDCDYSWQLILLLLIVF